MIWIVTTFEEKKTLLHPQGVIDLRRTYLGDSIQVLIVNKEEDLSFISIKDIVLVRSKYKWLIDKLSRSGQVIGESPATYSYDLDKEKLKARISHYHVLTPKHYSRLSLPEEPFSVFVKPLSWGDSLGIDEQSICHTREEVYDKLSSIRQFGFSMIEEYVPGRDCTVGVIKLGECYHTAGLLIESPFNILDQETKSKDLERYYPMNDPHIEEIAKKVFDIVEAKCYGRVDFRITPDGKPYVIEINLCPGLSYSGYMSRAFAAKGISYENMIRMIFETRKNA